MKISNILWILFFTLLIFTGCKKDEWVEIDSLSADGNEFYSNQKVKLWMCVKASKLADVTYEWGCDSGKLTQPQGLDEMTWQAPLTPGTYKVYCTVKIGDKSETRYHEMYVSSFFFEKFEKSSYSFKGQSNTTLTKRNETVNGQVNNYLEATIKTSTDATRYIYYNFADNTLHSPFGCRAKIGWISDFPLDSLKIGSTSLANKMYYEVTLGRDPDQEDVTYLDNMRFEWFPVGSAAKGLPIDTLTGQTYNGRFLFEQTTMGSKKWFQVCVSSPELNFAKGETKKVALNLDANYVVHVFINGTKILETDAIQKWRINNNSKDNIHITEWRLVFPNGTGGKPPKIYFDDAIARKDGALLTGSN